MFAKAMVLAGVPLILYLLQGTVVKRLYLNTAKNFSKQFLGCFSNSSSIVAE
jgi:hypothetical protein